MTFIVAGGCGFIGSHFVDLLLDLGHTPVVIDKLTYAGFPILPTGVPFYKIDINSELIYTIMNDHKPAAIFNFAAESHVCRSIEEPESFIHSNINGTFNLLQASLKYFKENKSFKYVQISTDEVFGDLGPKEYPFNELSPYNPHSPYAASKAAADHLVSAWRHTYGLPAIITNCSNNYGPRQHPEKLIPLMIKKALNNEPLTLHGTGQNIRDWIHVEDHCMGVWLAYKDGINKQSYVFGGNAEKTNIELVNLIKRHTMSKSEITFIPDRPGNDRRYAIDDKKAQYLLGWKRKWDFSTGLSTTIDWYMNNQDWLLRAS